MQLTKGQGLRTWLEKAVGAWREPPVEEEMRTFRLGTGRLAFRGDAPDPARPWILCLGGGESWGRGGVVPWPILLARRSGAQIVNLACPNAGLDLVLRDPERLALCRPARALIVQITGAHLLSNRFYRVHPWRNDRFLDASAALRKLYPEVDFTEFAFVRHMLQRLHVVDPQRFRVVVDELVTAWLARMRQLMAEATGPVLGLWFAPFAPPGKPARLLAPADGESPLFVDRARLDILADEGLELVELVWGSTRPVGKPFPLPARSARRKRWPGQADHDRVVSVLFDRLVERGVVRDGKAEGNAC